MKEIIGKKKCNNETLPKHLIVHKIEINAAKAFTEKLNEFFVNTGSNLANKILQGDLTFKSYQPTVNITLTHIIPTLNCLFKICVEESFNIQEKESDLYSVKIWFLGSQDQNMFFQFKLTVVPRGQGVLKPKNMFVIRKILRVFTSFLSSLSCQNLFLNTYSQNVFIRSIRNIFIRNILKRATNFFDFSVNLWLETFLVIRLSGWNKEVSFHNFITVHEKYSNTCKKQKYNF